MSGVDSKRKSGAMGAKVEANNNSWLGGLELNMNKARVEGGRETRVEPQLSTKFLKERVHKPLPLANIGVRIPTDISWILANTTWSQSKWC